MSRAKTNEPTEMASSLIEQRFREWVGGRDPVAARIVLFEKVRDIPYGYPASRDPETVLREGKGSCSGKHALLGDLFRLLGLRVRHALCRHRFNDSPLPFPESMQEMLRRDEIVDIHDYLQVQIDGSWVDVDATWSSDLREYGFPVNEAWDGFRSMPLSVVVDDEDPVFVERDPAKKKEELLARLSPRQRALRHKFLEALAGWASELRQDRFS
ncbi:MAG: hypothetical protein KatS3mg076_0770 [Candidatus Binatia bacterium]|nr:MAG: hypothetical protein KatS3mg076_0770 [Candidatus Binatia bacterium]